MSELLWVASAAARVVQLLGRLLSDSRLQALPEAGHMGPLTDAELFLQEVEQHLESVRRSGQQGGDYRFLQRS